MRAFELLFGGNFSPRCGLSKPGILGHGAYIAGDREPRKRFLPPFKYCGQTLQSPYLLNYEELGGAARWKIQVLVRLKFSGHRFWCTKTFEIHPTWPHRPYNPASPVRPEQSHPLLGNIRLEHIRTLYEPYGTLLHHFTSPYSSEYEDI
jgi:hypothetical protein